MPTFNQDDPNTPAVIVKATASPPRQFGAPPRHGIGIRVEATGLDTQAIQAGSAEDTAVQAVSQNGVAIHAVSGPGAILGSLPLVDSGPSGATIFSIATAANVNTFWGRNDAGGKAAIFEGSVQILNAKASQLVDTGVLDVRGAEGATAVHATSDKIAVQGTGPDSTLGFLAGTAPNVNQRAGVYGESQAQGVVGVSNGSAGNGVFGLTHSTGFGAMVGAGVAGNSAGGRGTGVHGHTSTGVGVLGTSDGSGPAGRFEGNVTVTGNHECGGDFTVARNFIVNGSLAGTLKIAAGGDIQFADCAEDFEVAELADAGPGTLMALNEDGLAVPCTQEYDTRVVGIVSGAGTFRPGIILGRTESEAPAVPLALIGKAFCKVDADYGAICIGDLLTSSPTDGHAMVAADRSRALGAIIGKALRSLSSGRGIVPVLIWSR